MQTEDARVHRLVVVRIAVVLIVCLVLSGVVQASTVTFQFGGAITGLNLSTYPSIARNTPILGTYTFESTAPDAIPGVATQGSYALNNFSVSFAGRTYSMVRTPGFTGVRNILVNNTSIGDTYAVELVPTGSAGAIEGPLLDGWAPRSFRLTVNGLNFLSSAGDALPLEPPNIGHALVSRRDFDILFLGGNIGGEITSLTLAPVPLPGALLLFGSGLPGLAGLGAHRRLRHPMKRQNH